MLSYQVSFGLSPVKVREVERWRLVRVSEGDWGFCLDFWISHRSGIKKFQKQSKEKSFLQKKCSPGSFSQFPYLPQPEPPTPAAPPPATTPANAKIPSTLTPANAPSNTLAPNANGTTSAAGPDATKN